MSTIEKTVYVDLDDFNEVDIVEYLEDSGYHVIHYNDSIERYASNLGYFLVEKSNIFEKMLDILNESEYNYKDVERNELREEIIEILKQS